MLNIFGIGRTTPQRVSAYPSAAREGSTLRGTAQAYDQFSLTDIPQGEEKQLRELVGQLSQSIRVRPTCGEVEQLKAQVAQGTYQPNAQEIAARMLLLSEEG